MLNFIAKSINEFAALNDYSIEEAVDRYLCGLPLAIRRGMRKSTIINACYASIERECGGCIDCEASVEREASGADDACFARFLRVDRVMF